VTLLEAVAARKDKQLARLSSAPSAQFAFSASSSVPGARAEGRGSVVPAVTGSGSGGGSVTAELFEKVRSWLDGGSMCGTLDQLTPRSAPQSPPSRYGLMASQNGVDLHATCLRLC